MEEEDYYKVLDVPFSSSQEEIKKAFRKKAFELHPDKNPNNPIAEANFIKVAEAYKIIGDPDSRRIYDRRQNAAVFLSEKFSNAAVSAANVVNDILDEKIFDRIDKILGRVPERQDIELVVRITLEELYHGADKEVTFKRKDSCDACQGKGAKSRDDFRVCNSCFGLGSSPSISSLFKKKPCPTCDGTGKIIIKKCEECKGAGLCRKEVQLTIPVPPDLCLPDRLIVQGEGEGGGDLVIKIEALSHPYFEICGYDLLVDLPINFYQAMLGDLIQIDTLKGCATFKVEEGSQPGDEIRLKGYGLKNSERVGDLIVRLDVVLPFKMSADQKEIIQRYKDTDSRKTKHKPRKRRTGA